MRRLVKRKMLTSIAGLIIFSQMILIYLAALLSTAS